MKKTKTLRVLIALAALGALAMVLTGGGAAAASTAGKKATVIKMDRKGKDLFFSGPATVEAGHQSEDQEQDESEASRAAHVLARQAGRPADDAESAQGVREEAQGHLRRRGQVARRQRADR